MDDGKGTLKPRVGAFASVGSPSNHGQVDRKITVR